MKIAQIVCTFPPYKGGIGNSVYNLADALSDLGHDVTVLTPDYYCPGEEEFAAHEGKFKIERLRPLFKFGNAAFIPQLFWKLSGFDVIHLHYPFYGALKPVILRKLLSPGKFKLILHYHMDNRAEGFKGSVFYLYRRLVLPLLVRLADVITCASLDYLKHSDLKKYYRRRAEKFRQVGFGVNLEQFVTYRDGLNERRDHKVLLFVGGLDRAHAFKGLTNLIAALAEIRRRPEFSSVILNVVGGGDLLGSYEAQAEALGLKQAVIFYDKVGDSKLVDFYNYCDCFVLPSVDRSEAFGLVLLEAMACSRPVVASNLPGVRSVFKNGEQGFLVKPGSITDLAEKILRVLRNKNLAEKMGRAGRELVEKKYSWAAAGKKLDAVYHYVKYAPLKF